MSLLRRRRWSIRPLVASRRTRALQPLAGSLSEMQRAGAPRRRAIQRYSQGYAHSASCRVESRRTGKFHPGGTRTTAYCFPCASQSEPLGSERPAPSSKLLKCMVPPTRLERVTPRSTIWCSNQLSYGGTEAGCNRPGGRFQGAAPSRRRTWPPPKLSHSAERRALARRRRCSLGVGCLTGPPLRRP